MTSYKRFLTIAFFLSIPLNTFAQSIADEIREENRRKQRRLAISVDAVDPLDFSLARLSDNKVFELSEVFDFNGFDKNLPTVIVTWSGSACSSACVKMISRFGETAASHYNVISINADRREKTKYYDYAGNWQNTFDFHANLDDRLFGMQTAHKNVGALFPLIILLDEEQKFIDSFVNNTFGPWWFVYNGTYPPKMIWESQDDLNQLAWTIYENIDKEDILDLALFCSQRSLELSPNNYHYLDTQASLLYKLGKYKQALVVAEECIRQAKKVEESSPGTEKLIEKIKAEM